MVNSLEIVIELRFVCPHSVPVQRATVYPWTLACPSSLLCASRCNLATWWLSMSLHSATARKGAI